MSKVCKSCNLPINKVSKKAIFCSNSCRGTFYRQNTKYNSDYFKQKKKDWYLANKDQELAKVRAYQKLNKEHLGLKHNEYMKTRKMTDISFKIACSLRVRLNKAIKMNQKSGSAVSDLGCNISCLKSYLESKFKPGMNWENHGSEWHLDHIKPLVSFDLTDLDQFKYACHYTNLQPLWIKDHVVKTANENSSGNR